jgi:hypothetical protein
VSVWNGHVVKKLFSDLFLHILWVKTEGVQHKVNESRINSETVGTVPLLWVGGQRHSMHCMSAAFPTVVILYACSKLWYWQLCLQQAILVWLCVCVMKICDNDWCIIPVLRRTLSIVSCSFDLLNILKIGSNLLLDVRRKWIVHIWVTSSLCSDQQHVILKDTTDYSPFPLFIKGDRIGSSFKAWISNYSREWTVSIFIVV